MPNRPHERALADGIEVAISDNLGLDLGPRTDRDEPSPGLRVDFTYDAANPPTALEITTLVWSEFQASVGERSKIERQLGEQAEKEQLGRWEATIHSGKNVQRIAEVALAAMRRNEAIDTVDLRKQAHRALMEGGFDEYTCLAAEGDSLRNLGLLSLRRIAADGDGFAANVMTQLVPRTGFLAPLEQAVAKNASKLEETRPRSTHLVVRVNDIRASRDATLTPPPLLPASIDYLWVIVEIDPRSRARGWWIRRGEAEWNAIVEGDIERI
ncbi:MAG: hypothetical protein IH942_02210 [Acidobacteria bacterium]|nr:hypothetical protein [Acidobacteriota bacterium]